MVGTPCNDCEMNKTRRNQNYIITGTVHNVIKKTLRRAESNQLAVSNRRTYRTIIIVSMGSSRQIHWKLSLADGCMGER